MRDRAAVRALPERFARHSDCNAVPARPSTPDEPAHVATGDFPHLRKAATPHQG